MGLGFLQNKERFGDGFLRGYLLSVFSSFLGISKLVVFSIIF